jgi:CubicO group peptidase (beta-lactamase class C family)
VKQVEALLEGAAGRVAPLLRAEVLHRGQLVFSGGNAPPTVRFDLASITKVMSTTALTLDLRLDRASPITQLLPSSALHDVTLDDLLFHRSGLRPFMPFFAQALEQCPALRDAECPAAVSSLGCSPRHPKRSIARAWRTAISASSRWAPRSRRRPSSHSTRSSRSASPSRSASRPAINV